MYINFLSVPSCLFFALPNSTALSGLHTTSERLGAAAASTTVYAGYYLSFSHCLFRRVTAAVAPNRQLCVRHSSESVVFVVYCQHPTARFTLCVSVERSFVEPKNCQVKPYKAFRLLFFSPIQQEVNNRKDTNSIKNNNANKPYTMIVFCCLP